MAAMPEIFRYSFFQQALLAAVLASLSCGLIGTYIVTRRLVFISGGISHASFGGIGIGYFLGINPVIGAAAYAVLNALGIEYLSKNAHLREDSVIGILWSFGMALGIIFIYLSPGYAPNLMSYLFGSIMTVTGTDLLFLLAVTVFSGSFFILFYRWIVYLAFDEQFVTTQQRRVGWINYLLMAILALTIVVNIRVVGIILVISLLTLPQTIANIFTQNFGKMIIYSVVTGFVASFSGLLLSYSLDIPSGATIIFVLVLLFLLAKILKPLNKPGPDLLKGL